jgi:hypothetical protein
VSYLVNIEMAAEAGIEPEQVQACSLRSLQ